MTEVFLVHPPVSFTTSNFKNDIIPDCPPLGLLYLAAGIEKLGLTVKILDVIDGSLTISEIFKLINEEKPKVVGITAMTMNIRGAVQLARAVKENFGEVCYTFLGGSHVSADPGITDRFPFFDFAVIGEADKTFPQLVKEIVQGCKRPKGIIRGEIPLDLDEVAFPSRHLIDWNHYKSRRGFWANAIMATRGCPFKCIFCSIPAISKNFRARSPKLVVKEMEEACKVNGIKTFVFIDDIFTLRKDYVIKLCKEIEKSDFQFEWEAQTRANLVDDEVLKEMKKAGCYKIIFGIESGNEMIRNKIISKNTLDKEIQKANELCWKNRIAPDWYLMLGFPTESLKEINDTINFPLQIKPNPNIIGVHITAPLPGSPLFDYAIKENIIPPNIIDKFINGELGEGYKDVWPYYVPKGLTLEALKTARSQVYRRFYFRPKYLIKRIIQDFGSLVSLKKDIRHGYALLKYGCSADDK